MIQRAYEEQSAKLGRVNILIAGRTGVGKSTLTNALGTLYIQTLVFLFEQSGGEPPSPTDVAEEFKRRLALKGE